MPGMPFNQMMTFPHELTLRDTKDGVRMFAQPIKEIEKLHKKSHEIEAQSLTEEKSAAAKTSGELFDIRAEFAFGDKPPTAVGLIIGDRRVTFDVRKSNLMGAPISAVDGRLTLQVLVDRSSIEVCINDGQAYITDGFRSDGNIERIVAYCEGGTATLRSLVVHELHSIWSK